MNRFWFGTEDSMATAAKIDTWVDENRDKLAQGRKAFFDEDDGGFGGPVGSHLVSKQGSVGVINIRGSLVPNHSWIHELFPGEVTSYQAISGALDQLTSDEDVERIVLDISSGGGAVTGVSEIAKKISRVDRSVMEVTAHTSTMAFSAAYWLASSARKITATEMAEVGSIGTLRIHQSYAAAAEKAGIEYSVFRAGEFKALGQPFEALDQKTRDYFQRDVEEANAFFINHVSTQRNLMVSDRKRWAEGKTFFAAEARDMGLIDKVSSLEEIISASGASTRRQPMLISEEKRAQIAAGAKPEDVLTAQEFTAWKEELEAAEGSETLAKEGEEEGGEAPAEGEEEESREANEPAPASREATVSMAEYRDLLKENARMEARLETANSRVEELTGEVSALQTSKKALHTVASTAVDKLHVALGKQGKSFGSSEDLVAEYNALMGEMAERFGKSTKQRSKGPGTSEAPASYIPPAFRKHTQ